MRSRTEQNIAKLFMAALIPGLLAALFYCLAIALMVRRRPALVPGRRRACRRSERRARAARRAGRCCSSRSWWWAASMAACSRRPRVPRSAASAMLLVGLAQRTLRLRGDRRGAAADGRDHGDDLRHPARRGDVQRLPRAARRCRRCWPTGSATRACRPMACWSALLAGLHPARRGDGRTGDDAADAAGVLPGRHRARFRPAPPRRPRSGSASWC